MVAHAVVVMAVVATAGKGKRAVVAADPGKALPALGLIAGEGALPFEVARAARDRGRRVHAVAYHGITDAALEGEVDSFEWLHLGQFQALLDGFAAHGLQEAVLAGKVSKEHLYGDVSELRPDARALEVVARLGDQRDDSVLLAVAEALAGAGIELGSQLDYCTALTSAPGVLGQAVPSPAQWDDIAFGWPIAKAMGGLDIGQSIVVEARAVLAVEAIEGTDEAIRRGGLLGGGRSTAIKVAKPNQDPRFDLPTVGLRTLEAMREAHVGVLAIEAGCTIILDRELLLQAADAEGVAVVSIRDDQHLERMRKGLAGS